MALIRQSSFAHGIVSPAVYGRADLDLYVSALREARNCVVQLTGGISNRQGTQFITTVKDHSYAPRLIEFQYKTDDSYALEIGDGYMRFVRDDAALAETALAVTGITQANPAVVTVTAHNYANGDEIELDSVVGMTQVNGRRFIVANVTSNTFSLKDQVTNAGIDSTGFGAYVSGGTSSRIYEIAAPWAIADVADLNYEQDKDTITFTHQKYPAYLLSRLGATNFTLVQKSFVPEIDAPTGVAVTVNTSGSTTAVYKVTAVKQDTAEESLAGLSGTTKAISNIIPSNPVRVLATGHGFLAGDEIELAVAAGYDAVNGRRFTATNIATNSFDLLNEDGTAYVYDGAPTYSYVTPYDVASDKRSYFTITSAGITITAGAIANLFNGGSASNSTDAIELTSGTMGINSEIRWDAGAGNKFWFSEFTLTAQALDFATWTLEGSDDGMTWTGYGSTHWNNTSQVFTPTSVPVGGHRIWRIRKDSATGAIGNPWIYEFAFKTPVTTGTADPTFVRVTNSSAIWQNTITWNAVAEAQSYNVYRYNAGIFGFLGQTAALTFTDSNVLPSATISPPQATDPFASGEYPGAFGFFSQRQVYGGSSANPGRSNYTQTGADNFNKSTPLQDDDAITADLVGRQVNEIRHYVAGNDLIVLTNSAEWLVNSGPDSKFTYATIKQKPQTNWGSSRLKPWIVGNEILFVEPNQSRVRNLVYNLYYGSQGGYSSDDLSLLASHLLAENPILSWCFAYSPDQRMHGVCQDGTMVVQTYHSQQKVNGWCWWDTKGDFENCCSLRTNEAGQGDKVYVVVKRKINGNTVRYIERVSNAIVKDVRDGIYLDSAVVLDNPIAIENVAVGATTTFTITAHGFSNGQALDVSDIIWWPNTDQYGTETQPDQFDGRFKVANATTNTFTLQDMTGADIDTTDFNDWRRGGNVRVPVSSVSEAWNLEGESVTALANGNVYENLTVSGGVLSLPTGVSASRIILGIPYVSTGETLDLESPQVTVGGRKKSIHHIYFQCYNSRGFTAAAVSEVPGKNPVFTEIKWRTTENMDDPTALYTGIKKVPLEWVNSRAGRIRFQQRYPLPMNITWVSPDVLFDDPPEN